MPKYLPTYLNMFFCFQFGGPSSFLAIHPKSCLFLMPAIFNLLALPNGRRVGMSFSEQKYLGHRPG
jgi:hypothetical protein